MSLKPSRRGLLIGMGATAADAVRQCKPTPATIRWPIARRQSSLRRWHSAECRRANWSIARSPASRRWIRRSTPSWCAISTEHEPPLLPRDPLGNHAQ